MSAARTLVGYFSSSMQASGELIEVQMCGLLVVYNNCNVVNLIQDVKTRWWLTWRMLRRIRRLRPAINLLIATDKVDCVELTPTQWVILH